VEFVLKGDLDFAEYNPKGDEKGFTGPFRSAWSMDYPSPQNYLEPLYATQSFPPGSNNTFYSNPKFDELVAQGNQAATNEEAIKLYQEAEDLLLEDMPIIPMDVRKELYVWSDKVDNVNVDLFARVDLAAVTVN
jgi:oligopeptide transport system substrate-binding protein